MINNSNLPLADIVFCKYFYGFLGFFYYIFRLDF